MLVIPVGVRHRYEADATDPWTIWWAHVTGAAIGPLVHAVTRGGDAPVFDVTEPTRVSSLLDTILRRMETDEGSSSLVAAGAPPGICSRCSPPTGGPSCGASDPIAGVQDYLRQNLAEHIAVDQLAAMAGFSVSHFSALFRRATGFGALEYQTRLRMSLARQLLDTTDRTVTSIARQVGYGDPMYFSRQFRRIHHLSPTQYRARAGPRRTISPPRTPIWPTDSAGDLEVHPVGTVVVGVVAADADHEAQVAHPGEVDVEGDQLVAVHDVGLEQHSAVTDDVERHRAALGLNFTASSTPAPPVSRVHWPPVYQRMSEGEATPMPVA